MTVDLTKIQPGDEVIVRLKVARVEPLGYSGDQPVCAVADWTEAELWPYGIDVVGHTPRPLKAGDRVKAYNSEGFVRAIVGERAWVDLVDDLSEMLNGCTYGISALERVS